MGDAYFQGETVGKSDADNYGSNWTRDELIFLRDSWRRAALSDLAERLGRTEAACLSMYYHQLSKPLEQRWQPADRDRSAWQPDDAVVRDTRPVKTVHEDEDRWWEPDYYKSAG